MGLAAAVVGAGVLGAGATVATSMSNASAAKNAANAQVAANNAAIGEQQREFNVNQANLSPWLTAGRSALSGQMALLGLGSLPADVLSGANVAAVNAPGGLTDDQVSQIMSGPYGAGIQSAYQQATQGSPKYLQSLGVNGLQDYARYWYNNMRNPADYSLPTSGATGTGGAAGAPVDAATQQQQAITALQNSPLYQSLMRNGQNTMLANASATGGLRGGNMQRSLADFGSDTLASVIQQQLANLGGISGNGMSTGGTLGQLGANTSSNISSLLSQNGAARGGGILGSTGIANAGIGSALSGLGNSLGQYYSLNNGASAFNANPAYYSTPMPLGVNPADASLPPF